MKGIYTPFKHNLFLKYSIVIDIFGQQFPQQTTLYYDLIIMSQLRTIRVTNVA